MEENVQNGDSVTRLQQYLESHLKGLKERANADVVTLFVYNSEEDSFHLPVGHGLHDPESFKDKSMRPRSDRGVTKFMKGRRSQFIGDIEEEHHQDFHGAFAHREEIKAVAAIKCYFEEQPVAYLWISYRNCHHFDSDEQRFLNTEATTLAKIIAESQALPQLKKEKNQQSNKSLALHAVVQLACSISHNPVVIWLKNKEQDSFSIQEATGVSKAYREEAYCTLGDGSYIDKILTSGKQQFISNTLNDPQFRYKDHAQKNHWMSALGFPLFSRGKTVGVIETLTFKPWSSDQSTITAFRQLADLAGITLDSNLRSKEAAELAKLSKEISKAPGFEHTLNKIVEAALTLTQADSSILFLYDRTQHHFTTGARTRLIPPSPIPPELPRRNGLTKLIIHNEILIQIPDTNVDERAEKAKGRENAQSLVGIHLDMDQEWSGVLYVRSQNTNHFSEDHEQLLSPYLVLKPNWHTTYCVLTYLYHFFRVKKGSHIKLKTIYSAYFSNKPLHL